MVSKTVGFDAGKLVKGRKRFLTVDTLGLVLRVWVTAASVGERDGGKQLLKKVKQMGEAVSRLHLVWVDGGFDGAPFMRWVMDVCHWTRAGRVAPQRAQGVHTAAQALGGGTNVGLAQLVSALKQRLRVASRNSRDFYLPCHDPHYGQAIGMKFDLSQLFKHPLRTPT